MKELVIISLLYGFDLVMNVITFGQWEKVRGEELVVFKLEEDQPCPQSRLDELEQHVW